MAITTLGAGDSGSTSRTVINDNFSDLDTTKADLASPTFTGVLTASGGVVGDVTGDLTPASESAEHGAGAIGTAATPTTTRWIEGGIIITQFTVDVTGLDSVATANDILCLGAGGAGYIGRNVIATNGVIFRTTFSCLETPLTGDNDINVVTNSSAILTSSGAAGTAYIANAGDLLAGQTIENLVPAMTANDYYYLTAGTGDTAATYTAGQYVLTTYGHALLT